jgi:recombination protein RecR
MSAIDTLAAELARLPGIGRKTALRLTYHLLKQSPEQVQRLAEALSVLRERIHPCGTCFNLTEEAECVICRDPRRDGTLICAVEEAADIGAIERAGEYRGRYHVLGGRISPLDGVGPGQLTVRELERRVAAGGVMEVIVATNPSVEGEATALFIQQALAPHRVRVTRIARGLPLGGDLEFADGGTIAQSLSARREMT